MIEGVIIKTLWFPPVNIVIRQSFTPYYLKFRIENLNIIESYVLSFKRLFAKNIRMNLTLPILIIDKMKSIDILNIFLPFFLHKVYVTRQCNAFVFVELF